VLDSDKHSTDCFQMYWNNQDKSRAIAGRTARCQCKFWYILNFLQRQSAVSLPQHSFLAYISDHANAEITHSTLIFLQC